MELILAQLPEQPQHITTSISFGLSQHSTGLPMDNFGPWPKAWPIATVMPMAHEPRGTLCGGRV